MHGVKRLFAWMIPRFKVTLISLRKKDTSGDALEELGIDVTYLARSKFDPATLPALLKVLDRQGADLVHLHGYGATTFGRLAACIRRIPAILHEHANLTDTPLYQKVVDRVLVPWTDVAIAVSASTAEFVVRARQMPAERTKVVYLGVPLEEFSRERLPEEVEAARKALGVPPGITAIGTVTRLMPSKGNEYLVEAARYVLEQRTDVRFLIVGEGELQPALERQVRDLGLADRVVFAGFRRDVAGALSAMDIVVFPSLWEGTPLTAFEALAAGRPIVATDADGLADILTPGVDALVVPRRDGKAIAAAVMTLLDDPARRQSLARCAAVTGRRYGIASFVLKMEKLYRLLHETSRPTRRRGILSADLAFLADGAS
jgi:glycosyltransferase involved in cell wall biosynthesis